MSLDAAISYRMEAQPSIVRARVAYWLALPLAEVKWGARIAKVNISGKGGKKTMAG